MCLRAVIVTCCLGFLAAECQNNWVRYDDSCYLFSHLKFNFGDAEQFCHQEGGYLVHIETQRENDFIRNVCMYDHHVARHWIGLSDQVTEGRWVWHGTNADTSFTDWAAGEPNQAVGANCCHLWETEQYHWADESCSMKYEPICETALNPDNEIVG